MKYLRDQTLGDLHVQDPLNVGKVTAEFLKAMGLDGDARQGGVLAAGRG
jgi:hypothetical protein